MRRLKSFKNIWQWVSHGDTVWGIVNILLSSLFGAGGGIITWFNSLPTALVYFAVLGGIALGLFISNELAARRIHKRIRMPFRLATPKESLPTPWLEEVLDNDKKELAKRLYKRDLQWDFRGINKTEPFIEVMFCLINAAIFPVLVTEIKESLAIEDVKCNFPATMEAPYRIPHGDNIYIRIKQPVLKETASILILRRDSETDVKISLNGCYLVVRAEELEHESNPIKLSLGGEETVKIPKK